MVNQWNQLPELIMRMIIHRLDVNTRIRLMRVSRVWYWQVRAVCAMQTRIRVTESEPEEKCHNPDHQVSHSDQVSFRTMTGLMGSDSRSVWNLRNFSRLFPSLTIIIIPGVCVTSCFLTRYADRLICLLADSVSRDTSVQLPVLQCLTCDSYPSFRSSDAPVLRSFNVDMDMTDRICVLPHHVTRVSCRLLMLKQLSVVPFASNLTHLIIRTTSDCRFRPENGIFGARNETFNFPNLKVFVLSEKVENLTHETELYFQNPPLVLLRRMLHFPKLRVFGISIAILSDECLRALAEMLQSMPPLLALCLIGGYRGLVDEMMRIVKAHQPAVQVLFVDPLRFSQSGLYHMMHMSDLRVFGTHVSSHGKLTFRIKEEVNCFANDGLIERLTHIHFRVDHHADKQLLNGLKKKVRRLKQKGLLKRCSIGSGPLVDCFIREIGLLDLAQSPEMEVIELK